jgi:hypothetical protein
MKTPEPCNGGATTRPPIPRRTRGGPRANLGRRSVLAAALAAGLAGVLGAGAARGANLVANGDFEAGTNSVSSDYTYGTGPWLDAGYWSVVRSAYDVHQLWTDSPDHTFQDGSGYYFVANGGSDVSQAVWELGTPIQIAQTNTAYRFEAYLMTCYPVGGGNGPSLVFQVGNGVSWSDIGQTYSFEDGAPVGAWNLVFADGVFSQPGTYSLRLVNHSPVSGGNDLGLDDLYFGIRAEAPSYPTNPGASEETLVIVVPEPSAAALVGLGALAPVLAVLGRRRA